MDLKFIDNIVKDIGTGQDKVLEILQAIQGHFRYLPAEALERVCELTEITPGAITGVSTFYDQFRHRPAGKYTINVCVGTACHVKGASGVMSAFKRYLKIPDNQDTDAQNLFTVDKIACLGCCTLAPAVQIEGITFGHVTSETVGNVINEFLEYQELTVQDSKSESDNLSVDSSHAEIRLGLGSCCIARGSAQLKEAVEKVLKESNIRVPIKKVGCVGMCHQTPLLEIVMPNGKSFLYAKVEPQDARAIVLRHFKPKGLTMGLLRMASDSIDRLLKNENTVCACDRAIDLGETQVHDFLGKQKHIATEHCGVIDPIDFAEYKSRGGFTALEKCIRQMTADQVIEQIKISALRGRGGAGFLTHRKWSMVQAAQDKQKYLVCNGDEGDPGAFMDRMLMESYPYRILEGMIIAAFAVGAAEGVIYIRAEYPLALQRIKQAIVICQENGILGENILGSDMSLYLRVAVGAGAFVCGEETALLASIEGRRGMPRIRPPYPAQQGLWNRPTLINNVETYASVPWIIRHGADAYQQIGTSKSKGTKVFALAGKIARGGLIEVPMGITIDEIVNEIGGGTGDKRRFKAVQVGGPSGGCIPADMALAVDYETLKQAGSMMGSGGMVVLDETDCAVDIARYFLEFTQDQSCGKCTFCRVGTRRMLDIMERICAGKGKEQDLDTLETLAHQIKKGSLCGLGKTAPNPVLSTLHHFRQEYKEHINGHCPAGKCKALIKYTITDKCIGCTLCAQHCPVDAIKLRPYEVHEIDTEICIRCAACKNVCPVNAVEVQ